MNDSSDLINDPYKAKIKQKNIKTRNAFTTKGSIDNDDIKSQRSISIYSSMLSKKN